MFEEDREPTPAERKAYENMKKTDMQNRELEPIPPSSVLGGELMTGGQVKSLVPQTFEQLRVISIYIARSGLAPKGMEKPESVFTAAMMGMDLGLPIMQAVQNIAVINGRPSIWGDAMLAVVEASGQLADFDEYFEGEGDNLTAYCVSLRKEKPKPIVRSFSLKDAKQAGLTEKAIWRQYPKRMLQMRARSWSLRDNFSDILKGMYTREEVIDMDLDESGDYTAKDLTAIISETGKKVKVDTKTGVVVDGVIEEKGEVTPSKPETAETVKVDYGSLRKEVEALKGDQDALVKWGRDNKERVENALSPNSITRFWNMWRTLVGVNIEPGEDPKDQKEPAAEKNPGQKEEKGREAATLEQLAAAEGYLSFIKKLDDVNAINEYMKDNRRDIVDDLGPVIDDFDSQVTDYVSSLLPEPLK